DMYWMAATSPEIRVTTEDGVEIPDGTGSVDFGTVEGGNTVTRLFTIHNDGEKTLFISGAVLEAGDTNHFDLDLSGLSSHIEPGYSSSFSILFHPLADGALAAAVVIHNNDLDESEYTFEVTGEGTGTTAPQPDIQVLQGNQDLSVTGGMDFGTVQQGYKSAPVVFTIHNAGDADLSVSGASVSDAANFMVDTASLPEVLGPGEDCWFGVTFTPTETGTTDTWSADVTIDSDDPDEDPYTFTVTGTGDPGPVPDIAVSFAGRYLQSGTGYFDFGTVEAGVEGASVTFVIQNTGTSGLEVSSVQLQSGDVSQFTLSLDDPSTSLPFVLDPGDSTSFTMTFSPNVSGSLNAVVEIGSDDPDTFESPYTFTVTGTGDPDPVPDIRLVEKSWYPHGTRYDFGSLKVGQKSSAKIYIENPGSAPLEITNILLTDGDQDDFTLDLSKTGFTVSAGTSTDFTATFTPQAQGERTRVLEIHSNDPDISPYSVTLTGFGQ
ncbi:MAG: choice-of-anchor D domain-containing protein, partial [Spirochaetota bacterium]